MTETLRQDAAPPHGEVHITSLLVHVSGRPPHDVAAEVGAMDGAEVHETCTNGKMIVSLETGSLHAVADTVEAISRLSGVINTVLVYHHVETPEQLDEYVELGPAQRAAEKAHEVIS